LHRWDKCLTRSEIRPLPVRRMTERFDNLIPDYPSPYGCYLGFIDR